MTYDLFLECLDICYREGDMKKFFKIWRQYPEHIEETWRRANEEPYRSEAEAQWQELKGKLQEAFGADWVKENCID